MHGQPLHLPLREFELLQYLMSHAEKVVTRAELHEALWGAGATPETNTLAVHIRRLRDRLGDDPKDPQLIQTVRGLGYRLAAPVTPADAVTP